MKEKKGMSIMAGILLLIVVLGSGILCAWLLCLLNQVSFGLYLFPLILCVDLLVFSTIGFFKTEGKKEVLYISCSIVSMVCGMIQIGIMF